MFRRLLFFVAFFILIFATLFSIFGNPPFSWLAGFCYIGYDTWLISFVVLAVSRDLKRKKPPSPLPDLTVSVLIPAHNEARILPQCLEALQSQTRRPTRILIVDDGSTDSSLGFLMQDLQLAQRQGLYQSQRWSDIFLLSKPRSGKARSLNEALAFVQTDIVITLDADTLLEANAIAKIVQAFAEDPDLKATGGVLRPLAQKGVSGWLLESFQKFEYIRAFLTRQAWMDYDSLVLVSGAFAAYQTQILKDVGGYDPGSLVEDYELIHRLYHHCYTLQIPIHVGVTPEARALTDCPATIRQFLRQRQRWFGGFLQTLFRYRQMLGNKSFHCLGTLMLPIKSLDTLQPLFGLVALYGLLNFIFLRGVIHPWVLTALLVKLGIDYVYHFYCLFLYNRWQKRKLPRRFWFNLFW